MELFFPRADNTCPPSFEISSQFVPDLFIKGCDVIIFYPGGCHKADLKHHHALVVCNGWGRHVEKIIADWADTLKHPVAGTGLFQVVNGCLIQIPG